MITDGIGIDIEDIGRFREKPYKTNQSFYKKIFTGAEIKYCLSKADPAQHFTARFCAKEAIVKALGKRNADIKKIEIVNNVSGQPMVNLQTTNHKLQTRILISLSHAKDYATAIAIVTDEDGKD